MVSRVSHDHQRKPPLEPVATVAFVSYLVLTFCFWGAFVGERGLPAETGFIELSQIRPGIEGFTYPYNPARRFMSLSFHLGYLLTSGSYLGLHLVFGGLILLTGLLSFAIVVRLLPESLLGAYLVGCLVVTYGADQGANWAGYVVQRQTIVFALAAVWLWLEGRRRGHPVLAALAAGAQFLSLWTYEASLPALLAVPLLLWRHRSDRRRLAVWVGAWLLVPVFKAGSLIYSHWILHEPSYEASVLASRLSASAMAHNLGALLTRGLCFWTWPNLTAALGCQDWALRRIAPPLLAGAAAMAAGALVVRRLAGPAMWNNKPRTLTAGLGFLVLSYVSFMALAQVAFIRTQLVSALPAAVVLTGAWMWLDAVCRLRGALLLALSTVVAGHGLSAGLLEQLGLSHDWAGYRKVMMGIVDAAPCVEDNTLIVLVDVPPRISYSYCATDAPFDPFRDVLWFNSGLQVMYPGVRLVGLYYRSDGSASESIRFQFGAEGARLVHAGVGVEGTQFGYDQMIAMRFDANQGAVLLDKFPQTLAPGSVADGRYRPGARISCSTAPEMTRRRLATLARPAPARLVGFRDTMGGPSCLAFDR